MLEQGYEGTGLGPLLASVSVPKGSFYHFFGSKQEFAGAVLAAYSMQYRQQRQELFADAALGPLARIERHLVQVERDSVADAGVPGCLYGVLSQAAPSLGEELRAQLEGAFAAWEQDLAALIGEAQRAGEVDDALDPVEMAAHIVDSYEGAVIRARAGAGPAAFARFRKFALATLRGRSGAAGPAGA